MTKYLKKPVVVEAMQWDGTPAGANRIRAWASPDGRPYVSCHRHEKYLLVSTSEGLMSATEGDWIIKGEEGEVYPCRPDIFALKYEPVEETERVDKGDWIIRGAKGEIHPCKPNAFSRAYEPMEDAERNGKPTLSHTADGFGTALDQGSGPND